MNKITITVEENSFTVVSPFVFKHLITDFATRFNSFTYVYNAKSKRKIAVIDKQFCVKLPVVLQGKNKQGEVNKVMAYKFTIESLMDFVVHLKFREVDITDKKQFEILTKKRKYPRDIILKMRDHLIARDYQDKYREAVIDNNMKKALIELQTGRGKELSVDCLIRIPDGWKRMGDIVLGDKVISRDGSIAEVLGVYPQGIKDLYKITFEDGRSTLCGLEHLWKVYRKGLYPLDLDITDISISTTLELVNFLKTNVECYIDLPEPEKNKDKVFDISPLAFGRAIMGEQRHLNTDYVFNKSILGSYLNGSTEQRMALLSGLLFNFKISRREYFVRTENLILANEISELIRSLGGLATLEQLDEKNRCKYLIRAKILNRDTHHRLQISKIEYLGKGEAQCIAVDHPERLYITDNYIVTHNTFIGLSIAAAKSKRTMLLLPGYIDKWKTDVLENLDILESEIYVIQGRDSIYKLIDELNKRGDIPYKVFIVSSATLIKYVHQSILSKELMPINELMEQLEIGTILVDEIHEKFYSTFYLLLWINTELLIGMTATYASGNSYIKKFQDILFPSRYKLNFVPILKYIDTYSVSYALEYPNTAKFLLQNMYNHDVYENNTIIANRSRLLNFMDMIEHYFEEAYLSKYKKGDKVIIFVASVRFADMIVKYFKNRHRSFDIRRYTSDDSYDNLMKADVIVSTLQSAGTAVDIPNLKVVLNTVVSLSEVRNKQSHGRLRKLENSQVAYYYFFSQNIEKHVSFNRTRIEHLKPYSKEYHYLKYNKKI